MKTCFGNKKGFTLIELMIALFITALVVVGYVGTNSAIQKNASAVFERTVALQDAHQVIERMRTLAQTGTFPGNVTAVYPNGGTVTGFANLSGEQITVSYVSTTTDPLDVTVTVAWTSNTGQALTAALRTYITQR